MQAKAVCCVCDKFLYWTDTSDGRDFHGYCPKHFDEAMHQVVAETMNEVREAFRRDEALRQKEE